MFLATWDPEWDALNETRTVNQATARKMKRGLMGVTTAAADSGHETKGDVDGPETKMRERSNAIPREDFMGSE